MSPYKYQMHCHLTPCSHCGRIKPDDFVSSLYNGGYSGAVITNHFYNGNTGIDRELPWKKFVSFYEKDYLLCKRMSSECGLDILFGIEEHVGDGKEILCYGITPEMLYSNPQLKEKNLKIWYETLAPLGVVIIQAHPFRKRNYVADAGLLPSEYIHGIELYNSANQPEDNLSAKKAYEENPDFIVTSGADAHWAQNLTKAGISCDFIIGSEKRLAVALKNREYSLLYD